MNKFKKLGLGRNEEHLNFKQKDFKKGNHKCSRILPTQSHPQTLHQAFSSNLILPCMHLQCHLQHHNACNIQSLDHWANFLFKKII
jgi:hypothetical protein